MNFQRIIKLFTQKIVSKLSKIWVWDPGSEIWDPGFEIRDLEKTYPGSRGQKGTGSRIRNTALWRPRDKKIAIFDQENRN